MSLIPASVFRFDYYKAAWTKNGNIHDNSLKIVETLCMQYNQIIICRSHCYCPSPPTYNRSGLVLFKLIFVIVYYPRSNE